MTSIKQVGPPMVVVVLIAGVVGYILGCTNSQRESESQARAGQAPTTDNAVSKQGGEQPQANGANMDAKPDRRKTYLVQSGLRKPAELNQLRFE